MAEDLKPPVKPPRTKIEWRRSEETHFNNNSIADHGNINSSKIKPFSHSLNSKLQNYAVKEQEYSDAEEDVSPISPRQQHGTLKPKGPENQMVEGSSDWQKETNVSSSYLNPVWQKPGKSRKEQNYGSFSHSFNSYRHSDDRKPSEIKKELFQTFISDGTEKSGANQLTNNKHLNCTNENTNINVPNGSQFVNRDNIDHAQESGKSHQLLRGTSTSSDRMDDKRTFDPFSSIESLNKANHENACDSSTHGVLSETHDLLPEKESEIMQRSATRDGNGVASMSSTGPAFQDTSLINDIENSNRNRSFKHTRSFAYKNEDLEEILDSLKPDIESDQSILHRVETVLSKNTFNEGNIRSYDNPPDLPASEPPPLIYSEQRNNWNTEKDQWCDNINSFQQEIDYLPEIPPSPPRFGGYSYINKYHDWNTGLGHKAELPKPRVITLTVYCGNHRYGSEMSYKSQRNQAESYDVNNGDIDYDFDVDPEKLPRKEIGNKSHSQSGHNTPGTSFDNNAYSPTNQTNWNSAFSSDDRVTYNNTHDTHRVSQIDRRHTNIPDPVSGQKYNIEIAAPWQKHNRVSNIESRNDPSESQGFNTDMKLNRCNESSDERVSPNSSKTTQRLQSHPDEGVDVSQTTGLTSGNISSSEANNTNVSSSFASQGFEQWNQAHARSCDATEHDHFPQQQGDQMLWNSSNVDTSMSHGDGHSGYKDTYRHELESRTFEEKANIPWGSQPDNVEHSSLAFHAPSDSGSQYGQNMCHDEIEKLPISSKTLSYPHHPDIQQSSGQGTPYGQNSINYDYHGQNYNCHTSAEESTYESEEMQYSPHEDEGYTAVTSKERGCGNCSNCRAMEMMDTMKVLAKSAGFIIHDVLPDGNCMFRSVIDQLRMHGDLDTTAGDLRRQTVEYLTNNPCSEDGTHMKDFLLTETWEQYLERMKKDGEWGDEIALRGISEVLKRKICIISAVGKQHNQITIHPSGIEPDQSEDLHLGHLNDSHYLSLRHSDWLSTWFVNARKTKNTKKMKVIPVDDRNFVKLPLSFEKMLDLNEELQNPLLYQTELIDSLSMTPLQHLSFVMRNVMNSKYFMMVYIDFDKQIEKCPPPVSFNPVPVGLNAEMLEVQVIDQMSMRLTTRKQTKPSGLHILVPMNVDLVRSNEDSKKETDFIVDNDNVHPGYLRLRPISETFLNKGHIALDEDKMMFLKKSFLNASHFKTRMRGPWYQNSQTDDSGKVSVCFKCNFLPESTREWQKRHRPSGWPKQQHINQATNRGCLILSEAHPDSSNPEIEYMYSFGEAEKIFARSFIKSQRYCFHVFRLVVELVTRGYPQFGIYLIKTVFFYASEVMPRRYWRINPGACLLFLVSRLLSCLSHRMMPHYFIKDNNLLDHFKDDVITELLKRIGSVREFPITVVILLAEEHGLSTSWMADPIITDIEHFCIHQDLKRSLIQVFVPTSLKLAENFIGYRMYNSAAEVVMETYNNMKHLCNAYEASLDVPPLFYFIQPVMNSLTLYQRWWLCFFIDLEYEEDTLSFLTEKEEGKTIADMVGEDNKGELGHVFVPRQILSSQTCPHLGAEYDSSDIDFLHYLTMYLNYAENYDICSHYQRCLVQLIKSKITNDTDKNHESSKSATAGNQAEYMKVTILYEKLYSTLIGLYHSYSYQGQPELFQEYIHDLENTCDVVGTKSAYKNLSNIWSTLGSSEMSQRALEKRRNLSHT